MLMIILNAFTGFQILIVDSPPSCIQVVEKKILTDNFNFYLTFSSNKNSNPTFSCLKSLNDWNNLLIKKAKYKDDNKVHGYICELGSKREEEKSLRGNVWSEKK